MISNVNDLSARLLHRTETEGRKMNEIAERELRAFGETLSGGAKHKLHTVTAAMEDEIGRIHCCGAPGSARGGTASRRWSADISDDDVLSELLALNGGGQ